MTDAVTGDEFIVADFAGKTIFVEPFATWCSNCRRQLGTVDGLRAQSGDDVVFLALSVETNVGNEALANYAAQTGYGLTFAAMPPEMLQLLVDAYGQSITNPPATPISSSHRTARRANSSPASRARPTSKRSSRRPAAETAAAAPIVKEVISMNDLIQAFVLGNAAILTNVCMLPLYPGLIAYMAGTTSEQQTHPTVAGRNRTRRRLEHDVAHRLAALRASGFVRRGLAVAAARDLCDRHRLRRAHADGAQPFRPLTVSQAPLLQNRYLKRTPTVCCSGPMTLPCTGPLIVSAFLIGAGRHALGSSLLYFLAFGLGFGWPLVVLPLLARPFNAGSCAGPPTTTAC
ncbi:MAG: hypothetical protein R3A10_08205 [Caldilineaceae bacterium]